MIHASCAEMPILQVRAKLDACARNTEKQTCPTRGNNSCHGVIVFLSRCSNLWPVVNTRSKTRCRKTCENIGPVLWSEAATRRVVGGKHGRPDSRDCVRATLVSARNCDDIDFDTNEEANSPSWPREPSVSLAPADSDWFGLQSGGDELNGASSRHPRTTPDKVGTVHESLFRHLAKLEIV